MSVRIIAIHSEEYSFSPRTERRRSAVLAKVKPFPLNPLVENRLSLIFSDSTGFLISAEEGISSSPGYHARSIRGVAWPSKCASVVLSHLGSILTLHSQNSLHWPRFTRTATPIPLINAESHTTYARHYLDIHPESS